MLQTDCTCMFSVFYIKWLIGRAFRFRFVVVVVLDDYKWVCVLAHPETTDMCDDLGICGWSDCVCKIVRAWLGRHVRCTGRSAENR